MTQITLLTGPERRRRWSAEERSMILAAAFAPGAVVAEIARQFDVSTSLVYKWRREGMESNSFAPVVLTGPPLQQAGETPPFAILVELGEVRVSIGASAPASLITATLRALR
jgi:transposase